MNLESQYQLDFYTWKAQLLYYTFRGKRNGGLVSLIAHAPNYSGYDIISKSPSDQKNLSQ